VKHLLVLPRIESAADILLQKFETRFVRPLPYILHAPVNSLSAHTTECPSAVMASHKCEPRNPLHR
jgi:hypothetical protein